MIPGKNLKTMTEKQNNRKKYNKILDTKEKLNISLLKKNIIENDINKANIPARCCDTNKKNNDKTKRSKQILSFFSTK
jgi:K+/H+ antiporter YhaU regulatory subunit KhtT